MLGCAGKKEAEASTTFVGQNADEKSCNACKQVGSPAIKIEEGADGKYEVRSCADRRDAVHSSMGHDPYHVLMRQVLQ